MLIYFQAFMQISHIARAMTLITFEFKVAKLGRRATGERTRFHYL